MSLKIKVPCQCTYEWYQKNHPRISEFPSSCVWCRGTKEQEYDVYLGDYSGNFNDVDFDAISDYESPNEYIYFTCKCGDKNQIPIDGDPLVCSCGRIYYAPVSFLVDETHIGDIEWLKEEYRKKHEYAFKEFEKWRAK